MLVLSRKSQQQICIGDSIRITILKIRGRTVRLGIEAPDGVRIVRAELQPLADETGGREDVSAAHPELATGPAHCTAGNKKEAADDDAQDVGPLALRVRRRCQALWAAARWTPPKERLTTSRMTLMN
ncbi:MAG: hypothetical protein KatS3mg109_1398 [Pirellulaceae bacterium]|nr:MAG: hypothetical protein KatS3mg109_1398 [Pirellulaceae bacterium]